MIDSHCHLDSDLFDADRDAVLARAAAAALSDIIMPAVGRESWAPISELASASRTAPRCHAALGLHPVSLPSTPAERDADDLAALAELARRGTLVAIGECGLDATIDLGAAPLARQEQVLVAQLALADALELPVILHARGPAAYQRLTDIVGAGRLPRRGGVLHSYGGGAHLLPRLVPTGLYFGFAGPATYPSARKVRASIAGIPEERLLAETDAPDQTPEPHRPGRNEPAYLVEIIAGLAAVRGRAPEAIAERTSANAARLFALRR